MFEAYLEQISNVLYSPESETKTVECKDPMGLAPLKEGLTDLALTSAADSNRELGSVVTQEVSELGCRLLWAEPLL